MCWAYISITSLEYIIHNRSKVHNPPPLRKFEYYENFKDKKY